MTTASSDHLIFNDSDSDSEEGEEEEDEDEEEQETSKLLPNGADQAYG